MEYGHSYADAPWLDSDGSVIEESPRPVESREEPYENVPRQPEQEATFAAQMVNGARYVLDAPPGVPALWGKGSDVLWAEGEALMIAGPQGVGKTTLLGQLVRGLLGLGDEVLGLPVAEVERVLYLAMDRPRQIQRSLARSFTSADRGLLERKLVVWQGPPPHDLAKNPGLLLALAEDAGADTVIVDSLKDAAIGLSEDEVGAGYNRARQMLLRSGRNLNESHHTVKRSGDGKGGPPSSINDIYGSTWLTSGAGSVILLTGEPGDPIVGFRHLKQPAEEVGPFRLLHDQATGEMTIEHGIDLVAVVRATGVDGLTAKGAAVAITEKSNPSRPEIEKARRKLDRLVEASILVKIEGQTPAAGGKPAAAWFLAQEQSRAITNGSKTAGQSNHALFSVDRGHEPITPITLDTKTAGQSNHAVNHGNHGAPITNPSSPLGEGFE